MATEALFQTSPREREDASMKRVFLAAVISSFVVVSAASIYAASNLSGRLIPEIGPITEQKIRYKLTADGFSNIQITSQRSIFPTNATKDVRSDWRSTRSRERSSEPGTMTTTIDL